MSKINETKDNLIVYKMALLQGLEEIQNRYFFGMFLGETEDKECSLRDTFNDTIQLLKEEIGDTK